MHTKIFNQNDKIHYNDENQIHRDNGPAVEYEDGSKFWYQNGKNHRLDGPAIEWYDGKKEYCINGKILTEEDFLSIIKFYNEVIKYLNSMELPADIVQDVQRLEFSAQIMCLHDAKWSAQDAAQTIYWTSDEHDENHAIKMQNVLVAKYSKHF